MVRVRRFRLSGRRRTRCGTRVHYPPGHNPKCQDEQPREPHQGVVRFVRGLVPSPAPCPGVGREVGAMPPVPSGLRHPAPAAGRTRGAERTAPKRCSHAFLSTRPAVRFRKTRARRRTTEGPRSRSRGDHPRHGLRAVPLTSRRGGNRAQTPSRSAAAAQRRMCGSGWTRADASVLSSSLCRDGGYAAREVGRPSRTRWRI